MKIKLVACMAIAMLCLQLTAVAGATPSTLLLQYHVRELRAPDQFSVTYRTGVKGSSGGFAPTQGGGIAKLSLLDNGVQLRAAGSEPLTVTIAHYVEVGTEPVTGTAEVPAGITATVTNTLTGQTTTLTTGPFSIPTGIVGARKNGNTVERREVG
jgi:hypothetical protein